jgi:hypothetical protein
MYLWVGVVSAAMPFMPRLSATRAAWRGVEEDGDGDRDEDEGGAEVGNAARHMLGISTLDSRRILSYTYPQKSSSGRGVHASPALSFVHQGGRMPSFLTPDTGT